MSRSRKRIPVVVWSGVESDRAFKRIEHGRERAGVRAALRHDRDPPSPRKFGDPILGPKDGKTWAAEVPGVLRK
jgi:hypothetical protein